MSTKHGVRRFQSGRQAELDDLHYLLLRNENHEGSAHCKCAIAVELRQLSEKAWADYREHLNKRGKKQQPKEWGGVQC